MGGVLLNLPRGVVSEDLLIESLHVAEPDALFGPSKGINSKMCVEDDNGDVVASEVTVNSLVIDFSDAVLEWAREYDPLAEGGEPPCSILRRSSFWPASVFGDSWRCERLD